MGEVVPLTKAIMAYRERREPRFRPVNGVDEDVRELQEDAAIQQIMDMTHEDLVEDCRLRGTTIEEEAAHVQDIIDNALRDALEGKSSDNIRLTSIRPWRPDDDGDNAA